MGDTPLVAVVGEELEVLRRDKVQLTPQREGKAACFITG